MNIFSAFTLIGHDSKKPKRERSESLALGGFERKKLCREMCVNGQILSSRNAG